MPRGTFIESMVDTDDGRTGQVIRISTDAQRQLVRFSDGTEGWVAWWKLSLAGERETVS